MAGDYLWSGLIGGSYDLDLFPVANNVIAIRSSSLHRGTIGQTLLKRQTGAYSVSPPDMQKETIMMREKAFPARRATFAFALYAGCITKKY